MFKRMQKDECGGIIFAPKKTVPEGNKDFSFSLQGYFKFPTDIASYYPVELATGREHHAKPCHASREIIERSGSDFSWDNGSPSIKWIITPGRRATTDGTQEGMQWLAGWLRTMKTALMRL